MNKTLGEIGYEAYRAYSGGKSMVSGAEIPPFNLLAEAIRNAWEVAATAISVSIDDMGSSVPG